MSSCFIFFFIEFRVGHRRENTSQPDFSGAADFGLHLPEVMSSMDFVQVADRPGAGRRRPTALDGVKSLAISASLILPVHRQRRDGGQPSLRCGSWTAYDVVTEIPPVSGLVVLVQAEVIHQAIEHWRHTVLLSRAGPHLTPKSLRLAFVPLLDGG
jgi:hypothetical protein